MNVAARSSAPRLVLSLLLLAYIFNFLDRQILGILAGPIIADLHLTDAEFGAIGGLAFALLYLEGGRLRCGVDHHETLGRFGLRVGRSHANDAIGPDLEAHLARNISRRRHDDAGLVLDERPFGRLGRATCEREHAHPSRQNLHGTPLETIRIFRPGNSKLKKGPEGERREKGTDLFLLQK